MKSVVSIKKELNEFAELSRLTANSSKSSCYVQELIGMKKKICWGVCLQMKEGKLRVQYLRFPLISKKAFC